MIYRKTAAYATAGAVPSDGNHHVDRKVDRDKVSDDPMVGYHRPQQTLPGLKRKGTNIRDTSSKKKQKTFHKREKMNNNRKIKNCRLLTAMYRPLGPFKLSIQP